MEWMIRSLLASAPVLAVAGIRALGYRKIPKNGILLLWGLAVCRLLMPWRIDWAVLSADVPLAPMTVYGNSATATVQNAVQETMKTSEWRQLCCILPLDMRAVWRGFAQRRG